MFLPDIYHQTHFATIFIWFVCSRHNQFQKLQGYSLARQWLAHALRCLLSFCSLCCDSVRQLLISCVWPLQPRLEKSTGPVISNYFFVVILMKLSSSFPRSLHFVLTFNLDLLKEIILLTLYREQPLRTNIMRWSNFAMLSKSARVLILAEVIISYASLG